MRKFAIRLYSDVKVEGWFNNSVDWTTYSTTTTDDYKDVRILRTKPCNEAATFYPYTPEGYEIAKVDLKEINDFIKEIPTSTNSTLVGSQKSLSYAALSVIVVADDYTGEESFEFIKKDVNEIFS